MAKSTKDTGKTIKCMEKVFSSGQMEECMKETISMTKSMVLGESAGLMAESTKASGRMALSTGRESTKEKTASGKKAAGNAANV